MDEVEYFTDDARLIADLLREQWSLGPGEEPVVSFVPESQMMQARIGAIYVYTLSMPLNISTVDFRTMQKLGYVSMRLSNRDRARHFAWGQEVMRILLANRRSPRLGDNGYTFMEVTSVRQTPDLSGWYTATFDVKLTSYHRPIRSDGFGPDAARPWLPDGIPGGCPDPGICDPGWTGGRADDPPGDDPGECDRGWTGGQADDTVDDPGECDQGWTGGSSEDFDDDPCRRTGVLTARSKDQPSSMRWTILSTGTPYSSDQRLSIMVLPSIV